MELKLDRKPAVLAALGRGNTSLYRDIEVGLFPPGVSLSPNRRAVAWPHHEVQEVLRARIAGKSDDDIRQLVKDLIAARSS